MMPTCDIKKCNDTATFLAKGEAVALCHYHYQPVLDKAIQHAEFQSDTLKNTPFDYEDAIADVQSELKRRLEIAGNPHPFSRDYRDIERATLAEKCIEYGRRLEREERGAKK